MPGKRHLRRWVTTTLALEGRRAGEITLRFVTRREGHRLNQRYRGKAYATNVLSFPYPGDPQVHGDLVFCAAVVAHEARAQGKTQRAHYAHLVVHGLLHLLGYDHEQGEAEALLMERRERQILAMLGFPDPYAGEAS
ncbi:MAG TPA: rRNA maturation RNase YbeY [Accumulibacter sp.]|nr:rRNA maturation RNase YbeY [Accumulibacter sp.]HNM73801.1 rRNA maturation RNase YbeY [Accumulibacter sp.]